jgi:2-iminobutanoate/2-iminopropanoate deaminase
MGKTVIGRPTESGSVSTQAVKANGFIFTTGNIGTDPETGELPADIETQTTNTLRTLDGVIQRAGSSLSQVVKVTVYMDEIDDEFDRMSEAYASYFKEHGITEPPARTTIGCRLPWSKVEMDMIALA